MNVEELLASLGLDRATITTTFEQLQRKINDHAFIASGSDESITTLKQYNKYKDITEILTILDSNFAQIEENKELLPDPEFQAIAEEEIGRLDEENTTLITRLKKLTVMPLPNDEKTCVVEIRPGVGGNEASIFAQDLFEMYIKYCNARKYTTEVFSIMYNDEGGINEATFLINESEAFAEFRFESGVHRVQRVPVTESAGRIHTSSASVVVMPQFKETDVEIKPDEIRIDVYRASGPGGQSVNTTDSAVRITHIPTGIVVSCQNGKSQIKNKEMAMSNLLSKLQELEDEKRVKETGDIRLSAIKSGDRSIKIRTYNYPQGRVTDHRIKKTWHNLERIMQGDIEDILTEVNEFMRARKH